MKTYFFLPVLFCLYFNVTAQNIEFKKSNFPDDPKGFKAALEAKKEGDYQFYQADNTSGQGLVYYYYALPEYLKAQEFNPNEADLNYKIGVCYLQTLYKTRAEDYLKKAYELNPKVAGDIYSQLAQAYHENQHWDEAKEFYIKHEAYLKSPASEKAYNDREGEVKMAQKHIKECDYGKSYMKQPLNVTVTNIGDTINTIFPEYNVIINADESVMMFTSQRTGSTGETAEDSHDEFAFHCEDIYVTSSTNEKWGKVINIGAPVNTNINDATIAIAPDGHTVLTYSDQVGMGDLFECNLEGSTWTKPKRMNDNINSPYHESSASFSYDGKSLYFTSNRPDNNVGDHDIYVSHWDEELQDWGKAKNLGPTINTEYSEHGVFAHPDGHALYFSSKGHETMGGFDIFKSEWDETTETWGKPKNIGYPINGPDNDVGFVVSASGKHGYISAYHSDSRGKEDIYRIDFPTGTIEHLTLLKGHVFDSKTKKPVLAKIEIIDLTKHKIIATFKSTSTTGHYLVSLPAGKNYAIEIESDGYIFHSENFNLPKTDGYHEKELDVYLDKIEIGKKMVLKNIFFDYDKSTLRPESKDELEILKKFMLENPTIKIEISGHTDNRGSHDYNVKLSEDRAHVVVDDLVAHGIDKARLEYKGYGEDQPIAPNDTEENMQLNRRTELKIIGK